MSNPLILDAPPETGVTFPPERLAKKEEKIWRDLQAILLFFLLGQLKKAQARAQGLQLIDEQFRLLVEEINEFYRDEGLSGQLAPESAELRKTRARITEEFDKILDGEDHWATPEGVKQSTGMLAILITLAVAATITVSVARKTADVKLVWKTMEDNSVCEICEGFKGEYDPHDPNLPEIPPHPGGRCWWVIVFEER